MRRVLEPVELLGGLFINLAANRAGLLRNTQRLGLGGKHADE